VTATTGFTGLQSTAPSAWLQATDSSPRPAPKRSTWRYVPALDGMRGLAVMAVLLYHAGVRWLPGGLLGVDAFFVLSGFLITGLLLDERRTSGRIALGSFWSRRAKRLLPALFVLLLLVSVQVARTGTAAQQARYSGDAISALGYVANWRFAFSHQGYFNADAPSPLLHLWSLGVEEQFYLLWPIIVVLLMRRALRARRLAVVSIIGALISAGWMALGASVFHIGADRLYYGTDTRAAALLIGAALAAAHSLPRPAPASRFRLTTRALISLGGAVGFAAMITVWATTDGQSRWLYRGGFLLFAIAVAAVLAAVTAQPQAGLARLLSVRPLVALGRISYGAYLFHWPLFLLLDHKRTAMSGANLLLARLAATITIATVSYLLLEQPIRQGRLRLPRPRLTLALTAGVTVLVIVLAATLPANGVPANQTFTGSAAKLQQEAAARLASPPSAAPAKQMATPTGPAEPIRMLIVGDSIAFSAAWALASERRPYSVDLQSRAIIGCGIVTAPFADSKVTSPVPLSDCAGWRNSWQQAVQAFRPAATAVFLGRWEITDRIENGATVHIGQPAFDQQLSGLLDRAIQLLSARSGKVALVALPCFTVPELADGSSSQPDEAQRALRYNQLLLAAAARHPQVASVVDLNAQICPGGQVISTYRGIPLRQSDGMHFDERSGPVLGPLLIAPMRRLVGAAPKP
jgi:peptidoglycan/LPS O-acetylase OafA/YrhL